MFGAESLNLWSLLLGLAAWGVPVWYLSRRMKGRASSGGPYLISLGCCGAALWLQIIYGSHLAAIGDLSAWMDTADAVAKAAGFLLVATVLLNVLVLKGDRALEQEEKTIRP